MQAPEKKPVILISGSTTDSKSVTAAMASIRAMGAEPMLITNHTHHLARMDTNAMRDQVATDLAKADGVMVMGNNSDIDPTVYGAAKDAHTKPESATPEGQARAAYEYALEQQALEKKVPLLGICAGMQRLNVLLGGSLHQHVPDLLKDPAAKDAKEDNRHQQDIDAIAPYIPVQLVKVEPGTTLAAIGDGIDAVYTPSSRRPLPKGVVMENSIHHQSVDRVGSGLRVAARSIEADKPGVHIVEAIEADPNGPLKDQFVLGYQPHPEFGASELSSRILHAFTAAARAYAREHPREADPLAAMAETAASVEAPKLAKLQEAQATAPGSWAEYVKNRASVGRTGGKAA